MSDLAVAAVLAATILVASMISIEIGLSVALIELAAGFVVGNAFSISVPNWLSFIGTFAGIVLTFRRRGGRRAAVPAGVAGTSRSASSRSSRRSSSSACSRTTGSAGTTARRRSPGSRSTTSLAVVYAVLVETGAQPDDHRQADHGRHVRHRLRHGRRTVDPLHQAEPLDRPVYPHLDRLIVGTAEARGPFFARYGTG